MKKLASSSVTNIFFVKEPSSGKALMPSDSVHMAVYETNLVY